MIAGHPMARVVDAPLSVAEHEDAVADKAAGAVVSFAGVVRDHDGVVPSDPERLRELAGVGSYTAAAVAAISNRAIERA